MKKTKIEYFPISALRETFRQEASEKANRINRSVARLTSCDMLPCMEYGEEVRSEFVLAQELFYLQHCRTALERTLGGSEAKLRYRWPDGSSSRTTFRKAGPNRVKVTGLRPL
jgi:hypothetical protein